MWPVLSPFLAPFAERENHSEIRGSKSLSFTDFQAGELGSWSVQPRMPIDPMPSSMIFDGDSMENPMENPMETMQLDA